MKVILKKDVPKLGNKNEIVEVSDGYAINYLIPRKLAQKVTAGIIKEAKKREEQKNEKEQIRKNKKGEELNKIEGKEIKIFRKANEKGGLFESLGKIKIIEILKNEGYKNIDEKDVALEKPIKETGEFEIGFFSSRENKKSTFKLIIQSA